MKLKITQEKCVYIMFYIKFITFPKIFKNPTNNRDLLLSTKMAF